MITWLGMRLRALDLPRPYVLALLVTFALNVFSGQWDRLGVPIPLDRVTFMAALVLLVVAKHDVLWSFRLRLVHVLMLLFIVLAALSAAGSGTLTQSTGFFALLDRVVVPFLLFAIAPMYFHDAATRRWLLRTLTLVGLYVGGTAVVSVTGPAWLLFPGYIADPSLGLGPGRARGPSLEAAGTGLILIVCGFAAAVVMARERRIWRLLAVASVAVAFAAVVLSQTRSIWVGAAAAIVLVCLRYRQLRRLLPALAVVGVVLVAVIVAVLPDVASAMLDRLTTQRSIDDRTNTNIAAVEMLWHRPLTGVGWSRFLDVVGEYVRQGDLTPVTNVFIEAHNVFLSRAAELGVPGLVLWTGCVVLGLVRAVLLRPADPEFAQFQVVVMAAVVSWFVVAMLTPMSYPLPNYLTWALAGVAVAHVPAGRGPRSARRVARVSARP